MMCLPGSTKAILLREHPLRLGPLHNEQQQVQADLPLHQEHHVIHLNQKFNFNLAFCVFVFFYFFSLSLKGR
jgi:hypothetical protein